MQDPTPPPLDADAPLVKLIGMARRNIRQSFWSKFARLDLTPQQGWILRVLHGHGPMSLHCLAQWVFMDDPTACRVVKTLQEKNLVDSVPNPQHGRRNLISVSQAGAQVAPTLEKLAEDLATDLEAGFTDGESRQLRALLLKVIRNLGTHLRPSESTPSAEENDCLAPR